MVPRALRAQGEVEECIACVLARPDSNIEADLSPCPSGWVAAADGCAGSFHRSRMAGLSLRLLRERNTTATEQPVGLGMYRALVIRSLALLFERCPESDLHPIGLANSVGGNLSTSSQLMVEPPTAAVAPSRLASRFRQSTGMDGRLGLLFPLLLLWLFFEFGRPVHPLGIPLMISAVSFIGWVTTTQKQLSRQAVAWFVLLLAMGVGIGFATNTYAAYMGTRNMGVLFLCICLPLQAQANSVRRIRIWIYAFLGVAVYVGAWAALHGGFGPGGGGKYDENYVATLMGMAVGLTYFAFLAEKRWVIKFLLLFAIVVFIAAVANAYNPSRGGFLGLCVVGLYCVARSPRKVVGFGLLGVMGLALAAIAGPAFWAEIATTTDYQDGTGDIRLEVWKCGMRMWNAHPFLGVGAGNFTWVVGDYQSAEQFAKFGHSLGGAIVAHSMFVEMISELGSVGGLSLALLLWCTWADLGKVRDSGSVGGVVAGGDEIAQLRLYADGIRASLLAVLVNGAFLSIFYYSYVWLLLALGGALPFVNRRLRAHVSKESGSRGTRCTKSGGAWLGTMARSR